jgi:hypothetical protein
MKESLMEDLIAKFPDDFDCFHGKGFVLLERQGTLKGFGRFDLLFEDRQHNKVLMELKSGRTEVDEVMNQIDTYRDALVNLGITNILMYVVATEIPKPHRRMLNTAEIECCEISEAEFRRVARKNDYSWPAEGPRPERPPTRPARPPGNGGRIQFGLQKPKYGLTIQWIYVPLIRNEFSIKELTDLFLKGLDNRPQDDKVLNKLFGAGIVDRSEEERKLKELFRAGIFVDRPDPTKVRSWITGRLRERVLVHDHEWFACIKYTLDGAVIELRDNRDIEGVEDNEPIRVICRPKWFDDFGRNENSQEYYGGRVKGGGGGQEEFYGKDGTGGRFPLRQGTPVPGDVSR